MRILFVLFIFSGCGNNNYFEGPHSFFKTSQTSLKKSNVSASQYTQWVHKKTNGINAEKQIGELVFSMLYKP
jgi:hypothetical protein